MLPCDVRNTLREKLIEEEIGVYFDHSTCQSNHTPKGTELFDEISNCDGVLILPDKDGSADHHALWAFKVAKACGKRLWIIREEAKILLAEELKYETA